MIGLRADPVSDAGAGTYPVASRLVWARSERPSAPMCQCHNRLCSKAFQCAAGELGASWLDWIKRGGFLAGLTEVHRAVIDVH